MRRIGTKNFSCDEAVARHARTWATEQLTTGGAATWLDVQDKLALIVSELTTNAFRAHSDVVTVSLDVDDDCVLVGVTDDAPGDPRVLEPSMAQRHGRGLLIVEALSIRWGVDRDGPRKTVWATLAADPA